LTLTNFGYMKRQKMDTYHTQRRGGRGISSMKRRDEDVAKEMFVINSHDYVMFFTNLGRVYRLKCYEIPEGSRTSKGMNVANLLPITSDEKVTSMIRVPNLEDDAYLVMITKHGIIKRTALDAYSNIRKGGIIAIDLDEGDELCWVSMTDGSTELLVATQKGMAIRFHESDVRAMGRTARGVKAMDLKTGDTIAGMCCLREGQLVLTVSETGYGRLSQPSDYRLQSRGGKGLINYYVEKYGDVADIKSVAPDEDVILISTDGTIIRIEVQSIRECARPSKGVRVMRVDGEENKVVTLARVPHDDDEPVDTLEDDDSAAESEGPEEPEQE
jgi:DNA gyrase subunit A